MMVTIILSADVYRIIVKFMYDFFWDNKATDKHDTEYWQMCVQYGTCVICLLW